MTPSVPEPLASPPRRVLLVGAGIDVLRPEVLAAGFEPVCREEDADFVLVYGGDGSLLGAEREFPRIPKVVLRRNHEFHKCPRHQDAVVLARLARGEAAATRLPRLVAEVGERRLYAINDVVFHNTRVVSGVRYRVRIDGAYYGGDEIVGDGLVVATPFGSSAYYRSITTSVFRVGIGLAFNNSTEPVTHLVLAEDSLVEVEVIRGPAVLVADNTTEEIPLDRGATFRIRLSRERAILWELDTLMCMDCRTREGGRPAGFRHV